MAQFNITSEVKELLAAGHTWDDITAEVNKHTGHVVKIGVSDPDYYAQSKGSLAKFEDYYRVARHCAPVTMKAAAEVAQSPAAAPLATDKQVALIWKLVRDGEHGWMSGPRDYAGIRALTRRDASVYIDSLLGN